MQQFWKRRVYPSSSNVLSRGCSVLNIFVHRDNLERLSSLSSAYRLPRCYFYTAPSLDVPIPTIS